MFKKFKKIKIFFLFLILFCSSFFSICSTVKSGPLDQLYELTPNISFEYNESLLQEPIIPFDDPKLIPVKVRMELLGPSVDIVLGKIGGGVDFVIRLDMIDIPEGCQASVIPSLVIMDLPREGRPIYANATISITVNQFLPAGLQKKLLARLSSDEIGQKTTLIKHGNYTQDIPFIVGYYSQLNFDYKDGNVRDIQPDETANFNFEIQNIGNGATNVVSEIVDLPDGWASEIVRSTILGSDIAGSTSSKTISLKIKPPIDFGYHEDRAVIKVQMTPIYYDKPEYQGEPHYLYFIVQSKGFFTPGFEFGMLLFAFIFVLVPIWKKRNSKNKNKDLRGKK
jgi:hypothetical protein